MEYKSNSSIPVKALLTHCHYRRVALWAAFSALVLIGTYHHHSHWTTPSQKALDLVHGSKIASIEISGAVGHVPLQMQDSLEEDLLEEEEEDNFEVIEVGGDDTKGSEVDPPSGPKWLRYKQ